MTLNPGQYDAAFQSMTGQYSGRQVTPACSKSTRRGTQNPKRPGGAGRRPAAVSYQDAKADQLSTVRPLTVTDILARMIDG